MQTARYATKTGAERYAAELQAVSGTSGWTFKAGSEPYGFAWTVWATHPNHPKPCVAGKRPRGGPRPWLPVDSDGFVHGGER